MAKTPASFTPQNTLAGDVCVDVFPDCESQKNPDGSYLINYDFSIKKECSVNTRDNRLAINTRAKKLCKTFYKFKWTGVSMDEVAKLETIKDLFKLAASKFEPA